MKRSKKTPTPKTTRPAPKKGATTTEAVQKDAASNATPTPPRAAKPPRERDSRLPAVGSTITKEWHGKTLEVKSLADGFEFRGQKFKSLSAVAKAATGFPSVNGFAYFSLLPTSVAAAPGTAKGKAAKAKAPAAPKIGGEANEIGTPAGQRAALAAAGIAKKANGAKPATTPDTAQAAKGA